MLNNPLTIRPKSFELALVMSHAKWSVDISQEAPTSARGATPDEADLSRTGLHRAKGLKVDYPWTLVFAKERSELRKFDKTGAG